MASLLTSIVIVFLLCHSGKVEWSTLIGPDLSRYFHLIGHDTAVKTQLKSHKVPYYGRFLPFAVSLWHKDGFPARKGSVIFMRVSDLDCPTLDQGGHKHLRGIPGVLASRQGLALLLVQIHFCKYCKNTRQNTRILKSLLAFM